MAENTTGFLNMSECTALSIRQPWATAIASGIKPVENRTWKTNFRGRIYIHASQKFDHEGLEWLVTNGHMPAISPANFLTGGIVGTATITDCVENMDSPFFFGPYGFVITDPMEVAFVALRGQLGFFKVSHE